MDAFHIGEWRVDPSLNRLSGPTGSDTIEPRLMQVLVYLAERPGQAVTRQQLLDEVWIDVVVNEEALTRAVSELRRLLGDDPQEARYIETIRKGGYRLLVAPRRVTPEPVATEPAPADSPAGMVPPQGREPGTASSPDARTSYRAYTQFGWLFAVVVAAVLWVMLMRGAHDSIDGARIPPEIRPVTTYPGNEQTPAISPDASMLAFAWNGPDEDNYDIYLKPIEAETPRRLTEAEGHDLWPVWDPGQRRLAYFHADEDGMSIRLLDIAGGEPRTVSDGGARLWGLDWSPDGATLCYATVPSPGEASRLFFVSPEGGESTALMASPGDGHGDQVPVWSPDGKILAFLRQDEHGRQDIWVISGSGQGDARRITELGLWCRGMDWLPDGKALVASLFVNGAYSLWRVNLRDGNISWVPATGEWLHSPSVALDGTMVYQHFWFEKNVWSVERGEGELRTEALIASTRWDCEAHCSADGEQLAFTSARSGNLEVWICRRDGSHARRLSEFNGATVGNPRFSPDARRVAFNASPEGVSQIHVADATRLGGVRALTEPDAHRIFSDWSRDGEWLYYGSNENGEWELWRLLADDPGVREFVTGDGAVQGRESFDGGRLFVTFHDRAGILVVPVSPLASDDARMTNEARRAFEPYLLHEELPDRGAWSNWGLSETELLFVRHGPHGQELVVLPLAGGELEVIAQVPSVATPSLELSPDGRTAFYARIERSVGDLYLLPPTW